MKNRAAYWISFTVMPFDLAHRLELVEGPKGPLGCGQSGLAPEGTKRKTRVVACLSLLLVIATMIPSTQIPISKPLPKSSAFGKKFFQGSSQQWREGGDSQ